VTSVLKIKSKIRIARNNASANIRSQSEDLKLTKEEKEKGVKAFYEKKGLKTNFHGGFVDLNPKYMESRHARAVNLAKRWS